MTGWEVYRIGEKGRRFLISVGGRSSTQHPASYGKIFTSGGMAEWFKATDLKSVVAARSPGVRIPLPPLRGGARVADWARLLIQPRVPKRGESSNPALPARERLSMNEGVSFYIQPRVPKRGESSNPALPARERLSMNEGVSFYIQPRVPKRGESPKSRPPRQMKKRVQNGRVFSVSCGSQKGRFIEYPFQIKVLPQSTKKEHLPSGVL
jgi:hypothetical protein